ncbi:MAG: DnaJ C-terminal domain-containing protein [Granulosicoccus sp.]
MKFIDYYKIMELDESAVADEIKRSYRKLARKYHPDVSKEANSEERFKEVGEAYQVLKDPDRRREYDELRKYSGSAGAEFTPPPGWQPHASGFDPGQYSSADEADFSDFFEQIFANHSAHHRASNQQTEFSVRGQDLNTHFSLSLRDAYVGTTVTLKLLIPEYAPDGSLRQKEKSLQVRIPSGVVNGQKIRLRGQGGPAIGSANPGDLYIEIAVQEDEQFHLDGKNVTYLLPLAPWEAALGVKLQVPTLGGPINLTIPPNAKAGQKLRLKGRGLPGKPSGSQFVVLSIALPEVKNDEQREAYEALSRLWTFNPREKSGAKI